MSKSKVERRVLPALMRIERREKGEPTLKGHAAVFDVLSDELGPKGFGFREKIAPGAFKDSLDGDVRALFNHDPNIVLGRTRAGTLRLEEDDIGLAVEIDPPESARAVLEAIERGDVDQMSFGFRTIKDMWEELEDGSTIRTLLKVELFDVSPVTFPAYPDTDIAVRGLEAWRAEQKPADAPARDVRERQQKLVEAE